MVKANGWLHPGKALSQHVIEPTNRTMILVLCSHLIAFSPPSSFSLRAIGKNSKLALMTTPNVRPPQQDRSRQSLEKVLAAARQLLCESDYADLTLSGVSKASGVSIGSIYGRFKGKDDLLQVVFEDALEQMDREWQALMDELRERPLSLCERLPLLVDTLAEFLARHAAILKPFMNRAGHGDIARSGKQYHARMADAFIAQISAHGDEIRHPEPERAIHSCFRITYSSLARFLGLGSAADAAGEGDWNHLKQDLGSMGVLFLTRASCHA